MKIIYKLIIFLFFSFTLNSQVVKCLTDEMELELRNSHPELPTREEFDQWLDETIEANSGKRIIGGVYQIPVIFHVIHSGEAVGSGTNISYAAIQSQIDVLNEDFRKMLGTNGYNTNPVGADTEIEFCLAKRRPDGSAFPNGEDGVNRVLYSTITATAPPYSSTQINATIKPYTYNNGNATATRGWHPGKYMNIWIANLSNGLLGYAQFPQSPIGGMGCGSTVDATDGVVFIYNSIGKSSVTGFSGPYVEGRTATHEIGHWLGLRHIWGDGNCSATDYCNDTPTAAQANFGCPTGLNSCTTSPDAGPDMVENYMDYTDDLCMNIFTNDQKTRMRTVLESTPLRVSLINSDACIPPNGSDASIVDILSPKGDNCPGTVNPIVTIKNRGSSNLTSAVINYKIGNGSIVTYNYSGNLAPSTTANITLPSSTTYLGTHRITAYTTLPNGVTDPSPELDTIELDFVVSNGLNAPYAQDFEGDVFPPDLKWVSENTGNDCYEWLGASATSISGVLNNNTAQFPAFGNSSTNVDNLITPIFILPCNASAADIKFDVAYRRVGTTTSTYDTLFLEISENCGSTWNTTPIYKKGGTQLQQNATTMASYYTPSVSTDWRTETIDLTSFITSSSKNVKFRFRARGRNGNNIYIDNFKFNVTASAEINIAQNGTEIFDDGAFDFGNVTVGTSSQKTFTVTNTGSGTLTLTLPVTASGSVFTFANNNLTATIASGVSRTFDIVFLPSAPATYNETFTLISSDCDEGTYTFSLFGTGTVNMPVANFTASSTSACTGTNITFTNTSVYSATYSWDFGPNAVPSTSTAVNPVVQFTTGGLHTVTLVSTNPYGSDSEIKTNYITAINAIGGQALPFTEGFSSATFPPTNWSVINSNSSATTWNRSATVGRTPTTGNSMIFNNFSFNDADDDQVRMPAMDLSSVSSAELVFDVAYAPRTGAIFDGLEVLVSTDCGVTFTSLYSKSGTTLGTASATTSSFVPTTAQWRSETVSLNSYVGIPNLIISFKNLSGNGQNLYIDNINVRQGVTPTSDFSASFTSVCTGSSITFTDLSTGNATSWNWTFTGGTPATSSSQNPVISYSSPGVYGVVLTASNLNGSGTTMTKTSYITISSPATTATCNPTRSGSATYGITNVTLNTINNTTLLTDAVINDYSCSKSTTLISNTLYNISSVVGTAGAHWLRAYIDYNNDGDFVDAGENIWSPANGTSTLSGTFTTPVTPTFNTLLRMRIIADRVTGGSTPGPCSVMTRGQAEDYGIIITPSCTVPTIIASNGVSRCGTGNVTFSATPSAGVINWYDAATAGNLVGTGTSFVTSISSSVTYYAEAVDGTCISTSRTAVLCSVNTLPTVISSSGTTRCGAGTFSISATPSTGVVKWYDSATGGTLVNTGNTFNSNTSSTITFYAEVEDGICVSLTREAVVVTILDCSTQLSASSCGKQLGLMTDALYSDAVAGATNYRYEVRKQSDNSLVAVSVRDVNDNLFRMSWLTASQYNTIYSIKVSGYVSGVWQAYGSACLVKTPYLTKLATASCGINIPTMSTALYSDAVVGATNYRYEVRKQSDNSLLSVSVRNQNDNLFRMSWLGAYPSQYNTTYSIKVSAYVGGIWMPYGTACMITTPVLTKLATSSCGISIPTISTALYSDALAGATNYRYEVRKQSDNSLIGVSTRGSNDNLFRLNWLSVSTIQYNTTYSIKVSAYIAGVWGDYGTACTVTTPSSMSKKPIEEMNSEEFGFDFLLETYPNPNTGDFIISSSHEGTFNILNELGQEIQKVEITKENNLETKVEGLDAGAYFVTGIINNEIITKKVIVIR